MSHSLATERDLVGYRIISFSISASVLENKLKNKTKNKKILVIIWMRHCLYLIFCKCSLKLKLKKNGDTKTTAENASLFDNKAIAEIYTAYVDVFCSLLQTISYLK